MTVGEETRDAGMLATGRAAAGRGTRRRAARWPLAGAAGLMVVTAAALAFAQAERSGRQLYRWACSGCHGVSGSGAPRQQVGFDVPLPDFTDCDFATREPNVDWLAVSHDGGPARGFSDHMPAFGDALTVKQLERTLGYIRTFCGDDRWPRGELNLPRALVTTKAYPEDEAVVTATVATEGAGSISTEVVYEQRFGARNQWEVVIPLGWHEHDPGNPSAGSTWWSGVGDVALALKRAVWHSLDRGAIVSVAGELLLPTGDEERGFGSGTTVFEPFVAYGQILPASFFLQGQAGLGLPLDTDKATEEAFLRLALGRSFTAGRWGRVWSPMVEVLGARELTAGEDTNWDLVPQLQVTLSARQHIMANAGLQIPVTNTGSRDTAAVVYLLWDWFDGGLTEGW